MILFSTLHINFSVKSRQNESKFEDETLILSRTPNRTCGGDPLDDTGSVPDTAWHAVSIEAKSRLFRTRQFFGDLGRGGPGSQDCCGFFYSFDLRRRFSSESRIKAIRTIESETRRQTVEESVTTFPWS
jgi:hypothetical protein